MENKEIYNEEFVVSIGDYDDYGLEYVISDEGGYANIMRCRYEKDRGIEKEYRVYDIDAKELYGCMLSDGVVSDEEGMVVGLGEEIEEYIEWLM